jgi:hypothetical protein
MKKLILVAAAAAAIAAATATITPASALTMLTPAVAAASSQTAISNPHRDFGGGISIGLADADNGISSGCYYIRRNVLVPGIGIVSKPQMVCG